MVIHFAGGQARRQKLQHLALTVFRRQIRSRLIRSFLYYVPYAVLTAMTIPDVLFSTGYQSGGSVRPLLAAVCGLLVAIPFAWKKKGLLTVAVAACVGVAIAQAVMQ